MLSNNRLIWLNGRIVPVNEALINVLSPTAQFGANVFEGIRFYKSAHETVLLGFRLKEHFDRLERSARLMRIPLPYGREKWLGYIKDVIVKNNYLDDLAIRQTIFVDGSAGSWFSKEPTGMFIAPVLKPRKSVPLTDGISCCVSSWERIGDRSMSPLIKAGANYINSRMAHLEAQNNGYDSAIFLNKDGYVAEGTGACIFLVRDNRLLTPDMSCSILESITRDTILDLAKDMGLQVEERKISRTELYMADELFLCGSAAELTPVIEIDGYRVGAGVPGKLTMDLHSFYIEAVSGSLENHSDWITRLI